MATAASDVRKQEQLGGYLHLHEIQDACDNGAKHAPVPWKKVYCALQNNLFVIYESESHVVPLEIVCLQFATISWQGNWPACGGSREEAADVE